MMAAATAAIRDTALALANEAARREVSDKWHPSGRWTNCLRAAFLERKGVRPLRLLTADTLRLFAAGHEQHDVVKHHFDVEGRRLTPFGICRACGKPVVHHHSTDEFHLRDEELGVSGYLDVLTDREFSQVLRPGDPPWVAGVRRSLAEQYGTVPPIAVEVKTIEPEEYVTTIKRGAMPHRMLQLALLKVVADRNPTQLPVVPDVWELLLVPRARIRENGEKTMPPWLSVPLAKTYVTKARQRIDQLNEAWVSDTLPECECKGPWKRYIPGVGGPFCSFSDSEDCCSPSLLETVTGAGPSLPGEPGPATPAPATPLGAA